jgi:undecaprenyl-diphosphatase
MNPQVLGDFTFWPITFLASFLIWVMFAALIALWVVDGKIGKKQVIHALLATLIAFIISQLIKEFFPTVRPFIVYDLIPRTFTVKSDAAFPSSHTAAAFGLATSILPYRKRIGIGFILAALLVGIGRVLGNVHYLWDIIGGAFIGVIVAIVIDRIQAYDLIVKFRKR